MNKSLRICELLLISRSSQREIYKFNWVPFIGQYIKYIFFGQNLLLKDQIFQKQVIIQH